MLDQCHNIEPKIPGQIRSVLNVQECRGEGAARRPDGPRGGPGGEGDVLGANGVLMDAYDTDVRPLAGGVATGVGWRPTPWRPMPRRGYAERIVAERVGGQQAGWGA